MHISHFGVGKNIQNSIQNVLKRVQTQFLKTFFSAGIVSVKTYEFSSDISVGSFSARLGK